MLSSGSYLFSFFLLLLFLENALLSVFFHSHKITNTFLAPILRIVIFLSVNSHRSTVKPAINGHLKIDKTKVLIENGSLMKVKSIAECSPCTLNIGFG